MPMREAAIPPIISGTSGAAPLAREELDSLFARHECGAKDRAELRSIAAEPDRDLRQSALRNFASRQESRGQFSFAAATYELLLNSGEDSTARRRLNALESKGQFGDQAELLLGDFFRQATSVEMLGGMAVGSLVGQSVQAFSLSRLLSGKVGYFTRGFGARSFASVLGFVSEVPAVVLASKALHQANGGDVDWGSGAFGHELGAMALSLGLLKCGSSLTRNFLESKALSTSLGARLSTAILPSLSAGTALFAAHRLESAIGLRPPSDLKSSLIDSAAMLLQFHVGGRLLNFATGGLLARSLGELQARSRMSQGPRFPEEPLSAGLWSLAGVPARRGGPESFAGPLPQPEVVKKFEVEINQMSALGEGRGGNGFLSRRLLQRLSQNFGVAESDPRLKAIVENYEATPFYYQAEQARSTYYDMLSRNQMIGANLMLNGEVSPIDLMRNASMIFRRAMEMNPFRGGSGSFYDYTTQVAFEQSLQSPKVPAFEALVYTLTADPKQTSLESYFSNNQLHYPFDRQSLGAGRVPMDAAEWLHRLEEFPVSEHVRFWLSEYLLSYNRGLFAKPFRDPSYNYYHVSKNGQYQRSIVQADDVFGALRRIFAEPKNREIWQRGLEELVSKAERSPVPLLYFDRFFKLLGAGDIQEKISELLSGNEFHLLEIWQMINQAMPIDGTIYTGYVADPVLSEKFRNFYRALPQLIHPVNSQTRLAEYRIKASELLGGRENFGREQILELLYHRPTLRAAEARQSILNGELGLEVLDRHGMAALMAPFRRGQPITKLHDALYIPASRSPNGRPFIAILQLDPSLSREDKVARAAYLAAYAVHEYDHHRHAGELNFGQRSQRLKAELRAWLEENLYLLTQGEKAVWEESEIVSPQGFALYLRSLIEQRYLQEDSDLLQKRH